MPYTKTNSNSKGLLLLCLLTLLPIGLLAQPSVRYFNDLALTEEATEETGRYVVVRSPAIGRAVMVTVKDVETGRVLLSETRDGESFSKGERKKNRGTQDPGYDFELNYLDTSCADGATYLPIERPGEDNEGLHYTAPLLPGKKRITDFLMKNLRYPEFARENNLMGKVYVKLTILQSGEIARIAVVKSAHTSLDKEAVRVLGAMKFALPAMIDGRPIDLCTVVPVSFRLE